MKNDERAVTAMAKGDTTKQDAACHFYRASANDFKKIPGSPIAYWVSDKVRDIFETSPSMGDIADARQGLATADNNRFLRLWQEVAIDRVGFGMANHEEAQASQKKWFPYNKGGEFRKWYGNQEYVVNWENDGEELFDFMPRSVIRNPSYYFKPSVSWSDVTSSTNAFRVYPKGFIHDSTGHSIFDLHEKEKNKIILFCNNKYASSAIKILNPTMHFHVGYFNNLPYPLNTTLEHDEIAKYAISLSKSDWDAYETAWDFTDNPLIRAQQTTLLQAFDTWQTQNRATVAEMKRLEEENNRLFIEAYGLTDELTPDVPNEQLTLTCNPHYRYGGDKTEEELEALLLADTMREFLSYATGCMFGRYSLDKPGLILANQGDTLAEYLQQVPEPSFMPNQDNVIPILDGDWFTDDITERFRQFLRVTFGEAHYEENLVFIEAALGKDIRKYFLKDFYNDHVRRYKKRPIYWLFSSPKGSFNALIYLHRYRPDTASVVLQYLRDFRKKLAARLDYLQQVGISPSASQSEKTRAQKEIDTIKKQLLELDDYERDTLYPLATAQIALDLDDGVKVNYLKLGPALKKIVGLDAKGED